MLLSDLITTCILIISTLIPKCKIHARTIRIHSFFVYSLKSFLRPLSGPVRRFKCPQVLLPLLTANLLRSVLRPFSVMSNKKPWALPKPTRKSFPGPSTRSPLVGVPNNGLGQTRAYRLVYSRPFLKASQKL